MTDPNSPTIAFVLGLLFGSVLVGRMVWLLALETATREARGIRNEAEALSHSTRSDRVAAEAMRAEAESDAERSRANLVAAARAWQDASLLAGRVSAYEAAQAITNETDCVAILDTN